MYKIIGADQKEYGPVTVDQLRQWIVESRINAQTRVQALGGDWKPLADFPEFQDLLGISPPPLSPAPLTAQAPKPKTSGLAVASLILGILGLFTCGTTALVGLILGIIAMVRIRNSGGRTGGSGLALAGTIVSAVFVLMLPLLAAMLLPAFVSAKTKAQSIACVNNVKQLALAIRIYSTDNKDQFPPAVTWCDAIQSTVGSDKVFRCPGANSTERCHYAFNAKLSGMDVNKVAPETVLIFETTGGWNLNGGPELMLNNSRHGRWFVVGFADGSVRRLLESQMNTLRWDP
jgi:prepilin-type processing-associated H-X9-DG protein